MAKPIVIFDAPYPTLEQMASRAGLTANEVKEVEAMVRESIRRSRPRAQVRNGKKPKPVPRVR